MKKMLMLAALSAATIAPFAIPASAAGDPELGALVFKKCMACHAIGEGAKNRVGPELNDVVGRTAGTADAFSYSQAMKDAGAGGLVWTPDTLLVFLHKPKDLVPGTKMTFAGLPKPEDEENVIAYLLTMSPNYVPAVPADGAMSSEAPAMDASSSAPAN